MVLVGRKAPVFKAPAVINGNEIVNDFSLEQYIGEKYVLFFFYPADFTFVCPSELIAFQDSLSEIEKLDTVVVGCSVDSYFSHLKWLQTPLNQGGIQGVTYPLVADQSLLIAENYDVLAGERTFSNNGDEVFEGTPMAYRGLFLIDKEGIVRHQVVNDMPLGRSVEEAIRVLEALQFTEKYGEVCPANWKKGQKGMKPTQEGVAEYLSEKSK
ncbi:MAG: peroxiredoxin [Bacteroidales bacterium]